MPEEKKVCPYCDSEEIDFDPSRGDSVCLTCGAVLEENAIVAEVGFAEDTRGRSNMVGQHVGASGRANGSGALSGLSREATAATLDNAKRKMWHLVSALRLQTRHAEVALKLFRIAVDLNFHKGRRMVNVCCACLYTAVRYDKAPFMLIDFADKVDTNVYVLGNTFLKFSKILPTPPPLIDPSLYIHRFAAQLEFGDKAHSVGMCALRIVARMNRDWLSEGRRPNGLCGASLIVAARMHNFYRSKADIVKVVRIGSMVLRDRLVEFDQTATANMTVAEITEGGGDDGKAASLKDSDKHVMCEPPAFRRAKQKAMEREARVAAEAEAAALKKAAAIEGDDADATQPVDSQATANDAGESGKDPAGDGVVTLDPGEGGRTEEDARIEKELASELQTSEIQELERESMAASGVCGGAASSNSTAVTKPSAAAATEKDAEVNLDNDLSDLDEEDCALYLNTAEEYEVKKAVWTELNKEYLERQAELERLKRENPEEYKRQRPGRDSKKRKRNADGTPQAPARTPAEAVARVMPKASSRKLNYDVLKRLSARRASAPQ